MGQIGGGVMHKEVRTKHLSAYVGWRWRTFAVGFGVLFLSGINVWVDLGFLYLGVEVG